MVDSVRVRLTIWYVGILALLLVIFSAGVYVVLRRNFMERADGVLLSVNGAVTSILQKELSESGLDEFAARDTVKALNFPGFTIAIFDGSGELLAERPAGGHNLIPAAVRVSAAGLETHVSTVEPAGGGQEPRRVAVTHVSLPPMDRPYEIVVSRSLSPLLGELATNRRILFVAVPLGAMLAGVAGWLLARKSLAPVLAMSAQAHRIGVASLDERLPVANPRDELGRLASTFNDLLNRLSGAFNVQRRFMADASHELRTPISVVRTTASVILSREHRNEDEYRSAVAVVEEQARRLTRIVEDLLRLARADSGQYQMQSRRFQMDEMLLETVQAAVVLAVQNGILVSIDDIPETSYYGDEDLLRQMVLNLVDNAIKYTPAGGKVRVSLEPCGDTLKIRVSDNGRGIPPEARQHIFDRFYRVNCDDQSSAQPSGAGLGLAIARWVAEIHKGRLELEQSGPEGSTFVAVLPC